MSLGQNWMKIALGWTIITVTGISAFVLAKRSIDKNRYEDMLIRNRMRTANTGEYEPIGNRRFSS